VQPQLKFQSDRGTDVTIFSPRASAMAHHIGDLTTSTHWTEHCNDLIYRVCELFPKNFVGVCQLPQTPGVTPDTSIAELKRCVNELGFVGCNLNPDPSGGMWNAPPLTDKHWYPFYEAMVELDVPAMVHVSASCNPNFPRHRRALPQRRHHGVHAVPHRGSVQGLPGAADDHPARRRRGAVPLGPLPRAGAGHEAPAAAGADEAQRLLRHLRLPPGRHRPADEGGAARQHPVRIEMVGAVRGIDPETGHYYDDNQALRGWSGDQRRGSGEILEGNARKVYPRIAKRL
jgi:4-oxalmesaconate hydratase